MADSAKMYVIILTRATRWKTYINKFHTFNGLLWSFSKLNLAWPNALKAFTLNPTVMVTDMIKWLWGPPASKILNSRLSKQWQIVSIRAGLKPMQLHWASFDGVWVDCSFLQDAPFAWEFSRNAINFIVNKGRTHQN